MKTKTIKRDLFFTFIFLSLFFVVQQVQAADPARITSPANGSTFNSTSVTFQWEDVGASQYFLYIGTSKGGNDLYSASQGTNTSKTINGLPNNGSAVYVRLWSYIDNSWRYNDYTYTAYKEVVFADPARITSPANGSTFNSTSVTFQWEDVGASQYFLYIGTSKGGNDLYSASQGTNTSKTINGLPNNGSAVYVRLWSYIDNSWRYNDYTYTAYKEVVFADPARITSPANGSTFNSTSVTFQWEDVGASQYFLYIGTSKGGNDLYSASQGTNTSKTINGLPNNGSAVYVRLWSYIDNSWRYNDYTYTAYKEVVFADPARITSPANGSTFNSTSVTFQWEDVGASQYFLYIGTSKGGNDLYSASQGTNTSKTINGLPNNGSAVYVRLWSYIDNSWRYNDYTYTAYKEVVFADPARITSPANGSTFNSTSVTFQWEDVGASQYFLYIGTSKGGNDLYSASQGTNTSKTINGLPNNGSAVYVRLWSYIDNSWRYNDYTYTAYKEVVFADPARITSPANGSTFNSTSVTFQWEDVGASQYFLYIGTSKGGNDLYSASQGTNTSKTINGLPNNGSTVYVRLWSYIDNSWRYNDYTYTATGISDYASQAVSNAIANIGKTSGYTIWDGVERAKVDWADQDCTYCARFVRECFGQSAPSGFEDADAYYDYYNSLGIVKTGTNPPYGAVVFYAYSQRGHIGIVDSQGKVISVINKTDGVLKTELYISKCTYRGYVTADEYYSNFP